jgi:alanine dehydrogenase
MVVTTTPSETPIVSNDCIVLRIHINFIRVNPSGKRELDPAILKRARIVVDDWKQASHSSKISLPLNQRMTKKKDVEGD